jgi:hypothetical protein
MVISLLIFTSHHTLIVGKEELGVKGGVILVELAELETARSGKTEAA